MSTYHTAAAQHSEFEGCWHRHEGKPNAQAPHGGLEAHAWSGLRKPCGRSIGTCSSAMAPARRSCTGMAPTLRRCWRLPLQQARAQCTTTGGELIRKVTMLVSGHACCHMSMSSVSLTIKWPLWMTMM